MPLEAARRLFPPVAIPKAAESLVIRGLPVLAFLPIVLLATYNLQLFPRTWFDEGLNLLAAKELAESGRYGLQTVDGFSGFDLGLSTGPTVLMPIALVFHVLGIGLVQARLVAAAYVLLAAGGLYCVARQAFGRNTAILGLLAFASLTEAGPLVIGRQVVGEVAALAFMFWGVATLGVARRLNQDAVYAAAGLLFGLAVLTKNQLALVIPVIAIVGLLARTSTRDFSLRRLGLMLAAATFPAVFWYAYQILAMGPTWFAEHLKSLSGEASASLAVAPLRRTPAALAELLTSGFTVWGLAGLVYVWLLAVRDDWRRYPERLILPVFTTVWLGFFICFSIGWPRYAVPAIATTSLFTAKLMFDLALRCVPSGEVRAAGFITSARRLVANPTDAALLVLFAGSLLSGLVSNAIAIQRARDASPQEFAALISQVVPSGAVVESSEWEIDFLTNESYHHPPAPVIIQSIGTVFLGRSSPLVAEYRAAPAATYIVDGPFSKLTGMYRQELSSARYTRIGGSGEYELLRRE